MQALQMLEDSLLLEKECIDAYCTSPATLPTSDHVLFESTSLLLIKWMLLAPSSCCFSCFWYSCDAIMYDFDISCPKKAPYLQPLAQCELHMGLHEGTPVPTCSCRVITSDVQAYPRLELVYEIMSSSHKLFAEFYAMH